MPPRRVGSAVISEDETSSLEDERNFALRRFLTAQVLASQHEGYGTIPDNDHRA